MHLHLLSSLLALGLVSATPVPKAIAEEASLEKRQSTTWQWQCSGGIEPPSAYRAFDVGNCQAQLTFARDRNMVGVQWLFDAVYADGSRQRFEPFKNTQNFAVSDPFYALNLGNNYLTSKAQSRQFTSVHEFANVCRNGVFPSQFIFSTAPATRDGCQQKGYSFTSPRIGVSRETRPAKTTVSARRINSAGDYEVSWSAVSGAAAYTVLLKYPNGSDELGNPYTTITGSRIASPNTRLTIASGTRFPGNARQVIVNVVNSRGVWSYTPDTPVNQAPW